MTSNQVHFISALAQLLNAVSVFLSQAGVIPHISPQTSVAIAGLLLASSHALTGLVTPNTNSITPDSPTTAK